MPTTTRSRSEESFAALSAVLSLQSDFDGWAAVKALSSEEKDGSAGGIDLNTDPAARRPQDQQIVLLNGAELGAKTRAQTSESWMEG